jgi:hypothetical protein
MEENRYQRLRKRLPTSSSTRNEVVNQPIQEELLSHSTKPLSIRTKQLKK